MHPRRLVLASTSHYRQELLSRLRVPFVAVAPRCDEEDAAGSPDEVVVELAERKAESLRADYPDALIIGSDQVVDLDGEVLGKPHTQDAAHALLARLSNREHRLLTAVVLHAPDQTVSTVVEYRMKMRALTTAEIHRYLAAERPFDCAGAYKIETLGISLFEAMEGPDFTSIIGLPLIALTKMLRAQNFLLP